MFLSIKTAGFTINLIRYKFFELRYPDESFEHNFN